MCSRTVSGTAYRFRHGSTLCSPTIEKILCRSPFRSGHMSAICARLSQKEVGVKRVETLVSTLLPRRGARHAPAVRRRRIPSLRFSEKLSARQGRTRQRQFACPTQPVLKRSRPERANPPAAVRVPRSAGAEKSCRPERANRLRGSSAPEGRCRKQKNSTLFRVLLRITHAYAFLINASRRSRPLSISVSEVA